MAGQVITKVSANSGTHLISTSFYGTCATAAGTAAKAVIVNDTNITDAITLVNGMTLAVKFVNSNSVANPTITVYNNSGTAAAPTQGSTTLIAAKSIYQVNTNLNAAGTAASTSAATSWKAGATVIFVYDGQGWVEASSTYNQDNNTTALTSMSGTLAIGHGGTGGTTTAAALTNLGFDAADVTFTSNTTNWTPNTTVVKKSNNVISVTLTGQAKAGVGTWVTNTYIIGTLSIAPVDWTQLNAYAQINSAFVPILCAIDTNGQVVFRTAGTAVPVNTWIWIAGTYIA